MTAIPSFIEKVQAMPGISLVSAGEPPIHFDPLMEARPWPFLMASRVTVVPEYSFEDVGPAYFDAIGVRVVAGRGLTPDDAAARLVERPAVITRSLASFLWADDQPLGQRFAFARAGAYRVVGVVNDVAMGSVHRKHRHSVFVAARTSVLVRSGRLAFVIKSSDPDRLAEPVRRAALELFSHAVTVRVASGRELVERDLGSERLSAWLLSASGLVAFLLGIGGVFGLIGYLVESRRREMGIRLALGAMPGRLFRDTVAAGLAPVLVGTLIGLVASYGLARLTTQFRLAIDTADPVAYIGPAVLMIAAAASAGIAAAWRIRRVSPVEALRAD